MRLIDADELIKSLDFLYKNRVPIDLNAKQVLIKIMEQPIVYDIDKVVEELEEKKIRHKRLADYEKVLGTIVERQEHLKAMEALDDAIEIVKQGLKEQNNDEL